MQAGYYLPAFWGYSVKTRNSTAPTHCHINWLGEKNNQPGDGKNDQSRLGRWVLERKKQSALI